MGTVDDIKAKADIVQIISEKLSVKKAGKHFKALCPFHGEKTPSFMISPELQIYKCFGCGESGDVISFLEKYEGMDFNETIRYLSERTGIKLDTGSFKPKEDREKIIEINSLAVKFYQYLLLKHGSGIKALQYLRNERKLNNKAIEEFKIGYSPEKPQIFESFFFKKKGFSYKDLVLSGICYEKYGRAHDRFSGRIVFPLFDHRGNTVGFSGRLLPGANPEYAKYINTPETPAYHKSELLYGLNTAKSEIKKKGFAIISEGELDVISPWQRGIKNIVAIKGSALTEAHIRLLGRFTKNITLALDTDFAGNAAAKRGIELAQNSGLRINVARLKNYKDPDEMSVKDFDGFVKKIKEAVPVYDFIIDTAMEKYDSTKVEGKMDISKEVIPFLTKISDEILKAYYVELLAKKLKVPYESVYMEVEKHRISKLSQDINVPEDTGHFGRREVIEEQLLALILLGSYSELVKYKGYFKTRFIKKIIKEILSLKKGVTFDIKKFSDGLPEELRERFNDIYFRQLLSIEDLPEEKIPKEMELLKKSLTMIDFSDSHKELIERIKECEKNNDKKGVAAYQTKLNELVKVKMKLAVGA